MPRYSVDVFAREVNITTVDVDADSPEAAKARAIEQVSCDVAAYDWRPCGIDSEDVEDAEVIGDACCCAGVDHDGNCCPGYFTNGDTGEIERCDECGKYATDEDAAAAAEGKGTDA